MREPTNRIMITNLQPDTNAAVLSFIHLLGADLRLVHAPCALRHALCTYHSDNPESTKYISLSN